MKVSSVENDVLPEIKVGDIVLHQLSKLYFKCENKKQERWMNMNPFYILQPQNVVPDKYFFKNKYNQ